MHMPRPTFKIPFPSKRTVLNTVTTLAVGASLGGGTVYGIRSLKEPAKPVAVQTVVLPSTTVTPTVSYSGVIITAVVPCNGQNACPTATDTVTPSPSPTVSPTVVKKTTTVKK